MVLGFWTDMPVRVVQTQIGLQSEQDFHALPVHLYNLGTIWELQNKTVQILGCVQQFCGFIGWYFLIIKTILVNLHMTGFCNII